MPTLPATGYIENSSRTVAEMKTAIEAVRDVSSVQPGGAARTELTIASGTVTPATRDHGGNFTLDTEGDAASDDLDTITYTNLPDGSVIRVWAENASRVVTLKHGNGGAGELLLVDDADFALDALDKWVLFERRSTSWVEVARSYGVEGEITNLTAITALDSADQVAVHDDGDGVPKKITVANARLALRHTNECFVFAAVASDHNLSEGSATILRMVDSATNGVDVGGDYDNATWTFTCPATGYYRVTGVFYQGNATLDDGEIVRALLYQDTGSGLTQKRILSTFRVGATALPNALPFTAVVYQAAGDKLAVYGYVGTSTAGTPQAIAAENWVTYERVY